MKFHGGVCDISLGVVTFYGLLVKKKSTIFRPFGCLGSFVIPLFFKIKVSEVVRNSQK